MTGFMARHRLWFILGSCILLSLGFLSFHFRNTEPNTPLESAVITALTPIQRAAKSSWSLISNLTVKYGQLLHAAEERKGLLEELDSLQWQINQYREVVFQNERLRELLDYTSRFSYSFVVAEVICWDASNWASSLFINRGSRDGIEKDMAVITYLGVVGQVISATPWVSEVQIILSPESGISSFVQRTRSRGIVTGGLGRNRCLMKYIETTETPRAEDTVITSGYDYIFPKGLVIGKITKTERQAHELLQSVIIDTAVDFSNLEEVLVLLNQKLIPGFSVPELVGPELPLPTPQPESSSSERESLFEQQLQLDDAAVVRGNGYGLEIAIEDFESEAE